MSNPGKAVKASAVTASSSNGGNTPDKSVDGDATSRWESEQGNDKEWILYDLGAKTMVNAMQITWENAAAAEFAIELSDDAQTFYQARYIVGSTGGTQQFMNLNSNARYIRIRGVKRTTTFGYSIYETTFESPGSMFRTAPLWGIGMTRRVAGAERTSAAPIPMGYLHVGRASTIMEAILWHDGEAATAKNRFIQLSAGDRTALLAFIDSL